MTEQNLYDTPNANLDTQREEYYQPKILSWSGRLGRLRFFTYYFVNVLLVMTLLALLSASVVGAQNLQAVFGLLFGIIYITAFVFVISLFKRRLNDINASGWFSLVMFIPLLNFILFLVLLFMPGTNTSNRFGAMPAANKTAAMVGILLVAFTFVGIVAAISIPAYQKFAQSRQSYYSQMDGRVPQSNP